MKKHNCIEKERKKMMRQSDNILGVRFDLSTIQTWNHRTKRYGGENKTGQTIWIRFSKTNKAGKKIEKEVKTFITHSHCPFCGKRYQSI